MQCVNDICARIQNSSNGHGLMWNLPLYKSSSTCLATFSFFFMGPLLEEQLSGRQYGKRLQSGNHLVHRLILNDCLPAFDLLLLFLLKRIFSRILLQPYSRYVQWPLSFTCGRTSNLCGRATARTRWKCYASGDRGATMTSSSSRQMCSSLSSPARTISLETTRTSSQLTQSRTLSMPWPNWKG